MKHMKLHEKWRLSLMLLAVPKNLSRAPKKPLCPLCSLRFPYLLHLTYYLLPITSDSRQADSVPVKYAEKELRPLPNMLTNKELCNIWHTGGNGSPSPSMIVKRVAQWGKRRNHN